MSEPTLTGNRTRDLPAFHGSLKWCSECGYYIPPTSPYAAHWCVEASVVPEPAISRSFE